jgi:hypothetical protein
MMFGTQASETELRAEKSALLCRERLNVELLVDAIDELLSLRMEYARLTEQVASFVTRLDCIPDVIALENLPTKELPPQEAPHDRD